MKKLKAISFMIALVAFVVARPVFAQLMGDMQIYFDAMSPAEQRNAAHLISTQTEGIAAAIGASILGGRDSGGQPVTHNPYINDVSGGIAMMIENKPADTVTYVADVMHNNFGIVPAAYAQDTRGLGFVGLQPVLKIWKALRNVTYLLFILVMILVGFFIMFRAKVGGQTAVTIQAALPRIVVTMVLITFSYAIAGLMIDLIYFLIFFVAGVFQLGGLLVNGQAAANALLSKSIFGVGFQYMLESAGTVASGINVIVTQIISVPMLAQLGGGLSSVIGFLIAAVAILIAMVRTFFSLLKAYVSLILNVVTAPLQIMLNAFPGSNAFTSWLKKIAADALIFPTIAAVILLGVVLMGKSVHGTQNHDILVEEGVGYSSIFSGSGTAGNGAGFSPPFVIPGNEGVAEALQAIIGFGILMLLPEVVNIVRGIMGVEDKLGALAWENAIRGAAPITTLGRLGYRTGVGYGEAQMYARYTAAPNRRNRAIWQMYRSIFGLNRG
jgi:hypothetical protein